MAVVVLNIISCLVTSAVELTSWTGDDDDDDDDDEVPSDSSTSV